jgi:hypothetical protein
MFRHFRRYRFYIPDGSGRNGRIVTLRFGYRPPDEPGDTTCGFYCDSSNGVWRTFMGNGHSFDEALVDLFIQHPSARSVP